MSIKGDTTSITDQVEKIMIKIATVRGFPIRIKCICERAAFPDVNNAVHSLMDPYFDFFDRLKNSGRLKKILWVVLQPTLSFNLCIVNLICWKLC